MRTDRQRQMGSAGAKEVSAKFARLGWGVAENHEHDLGTDLYLAPRDKRLFDLARVAGAQVKGGYASNPKGKYFQHPKYDSDGRLTGWWYYESKQDHFHYWINHHAPHILVLHDLDTSTSHWVHVTREKVTFLSRGAKIFVPANQTIDDENAEELLEFATSRGNYPSWERSSWDGAMNLSPKDAYRHALVAPRLVAPHPNQSPASLTAPQATALVVLGRQREHQPPYAERMPRLSTISDTDEWGWQLASGIDRMVERSDLSGLERALGSATAPHERAASAVALMAAYLEDGKPQAAIDLADVQCRNDNLNSIDHAWVSLQHARAELEFGRLKNVRATSMRILGLSASAPHDVTASAISGAAAQLLFAAAEWDEIDFGATVAATDTAVAWWRQQVTNSGLVKQAEEAFNAWAMETPAKIDTRAWKSLRAATLMAGFLGDRGAWLPSLKHLAQHVLTSTAYSDDHDVIVNALHMLRTAGAYKELQSATARIMDNGPATAVQEAAAQCELGDSTFTTLHADIVFLTAAADLLDQHHAQSTAEWAMRTFDDGLGRFCGSQFDAELSLAELLASLTPILSAAKQHEMLRWLLGLELDRPALTDRAFRDLVAQIPEHVWTARDAEAAASRAKTAEGELRFALLKAAANHLPELRAGLETLALADSGSALRALGSVTGYSDELVEGLRCRAGGALTATVESGDRSKSFSKPNYAECLILLNRWHPANAEWKPLLDWLAVTDSHFDLPRALHVLASTVPELPTDVVEALVPVAARLTRTEDHRRTGRHEHRPAARHLIAALAKRQRAQIEPQSIAALLAGGRHDRQSAAIMCNDPDPIGDGVLLGLAYDPDAHVRATVASVVTHRAGNGDPLALALLPDLLNDPGTAVPIAMAMQTSSDWSPDLVDQLGLLLNHPSARTRAFAAPLLPTNMRQDPQLGR